MTKLTPPIWMVRPGEGAALLTLARVGAPLALPTGGETVKLVLLLVPVAVVTVTLPLVAPEGTATISCDLLA
ncbi:hypothetical protein D3C87_2144370 [compost metagenome]